ncbi:MAG: hypothetical protein V5A24_00600, partial [Haloarculaceae archaeon]
MVHIYLPPHPRRNILTEAKRRPSQRSLNIAEVDVNPASRSPGAQRAKRASSPDRLAMVHIYLPPHPRRNILTEAKRRPSQRSLNIAEVDVN